MKLLFITISVFFSFLCFSQSNDTNRHFITIVKFDSLINKHLDTTLEYLDTTNAFELIRIVNSLSKYNLYEIDKKEYVDIYKKFIFKDIFIIAKLIGAERHGGSLYSRKYNITIGGDPPPNSMYYIIGIKIFTLRK